MIYYIFVGDDSHFYKWEQKFASSSGSSISDFDISLRRIPQQERQGVLEKIIVQEGKMDDKALIAAMIVFEQFCNFLYNQVLEYFYLRRRKLPLRSVRDKDSFYQVGVLISDFDKSLRRIAEMRISQQERQGVLE